MILLLSAFWMCKKATVHQQVLHTLQCENTARRCCVYAFLYYPQVAKKRINAGFIHLFLLSPLATGRERGYTSMQVSALAKFNPNQSPKTGAVLHHYMKK